MDDDSFNVEAIEPTAVYGPTDWRPYAVYTAVTQDEATDE